MAPLKLCRPRRPLVPLCRNEGPGQTSKRLRITYNNKLGIDGVGPLSGGHHNSLKVCSWFIIKHFVGKLSIVRGRTLSDNTFQCSDLLAYSNDWLPLQMVFYFFYFSSWNRFMDLVHPLSQMFHPLRAHCHSTLVTRRISLGHSSRAKVLISETDVCYFAVFWTSHSYITSLGISNSWHSKVTGYKLDFRLRRILPYATTSR
jgi:hypothetical protein